MIGQTPDGRQLPLDNVVTLGTTLLSHAESNSEPHPIFHGPGTPHLLIQDLTQMSFVSLDPTCFAYGDPSEKGR